METWATFSIIDHRKPVYRQALALFDRIVVPLPDEPIGDQTEEELDQLSADLDYLEENKAAKRIDWKTSDFEKWRAPYLGEALATKINRDPFLDTRLMLSEEVTSDEVVGVPVYGDVEQFMGTKVNLMQANEALTIELMQKLPVPERDRPFEDLILLRQNPAFRKSLEDLLEWKRDKAPGILLAEDRRSALNLAMKDFDRLTKAYAEAMESAGYKKAGSVGSIFLSIFTGELIGAIKETLVSFREMREPSWQKLTEMKCAPGGVVYHFIEAQR